MHEPHYIIELSARHFNVSAKDMCTNKNIINVSTSKRVAYVLLHKYCALEAYRIAFIFGVTECSVKDSIRSSIENIVVRQAVKEIESMYLIVRSTVGIL